MNRVTRPGKGLITLAEAARIAGLSERQFLRHAAAGKVTRYRPPAKRQPVGYKAEEVRKAFTPKADSGNSGQGG